VEGRLIFRTGALFANSTGRIEPLAEAVLQGMSLMAKNLVVEGEGALPFLIYRCGISRYGQQNEPIERVKEYWTEQEVLDFSPRLDSHYVVYVKRKPIPLHEFRIGKR
jgi:hypothetical protein